MRIGINATSLSDRPSGARQRFIGLYGALFAANPGNDYLIYEPIDCRVGAWFAEFANVRGIATPMPSHNRWGRLLRGLGFWPRQFAKDRLDLFETLHLPLTRARGCPTLVTIHDIRDGSDQAPSFRRMLYRWILRRALAKAHVITVSNAMRDDIIALVPEARITTIYNGICASRAMVQSAAAHALILPTDYLLAVGHFEPRKNYPALLAAMALLRTTNSDLGLVIVGKDGGTLAATAALVGELCLGSSVRLLSDVDDATLTALYHDARMLVFPSTYEGFGIPLLEAMAAGCPLALSDLPVFRELSEGQADYFDPHDPATIAATISALLASPSRREAQRAYGRHRVADFAFATLAEQLAALHRRLAQPLCNSSPAPHFVSDQRAARTSIR